MSLLHHQDYPKWKADNSCGCGPENSKIDLVPDTIYGLSIKEACCPHDHRFYLGGTIIDFNIANIELLNNILFIIDDYKVSNQEGKWNKIECMVYPHFLARRRAMLYYEAVCIKGEEYFNFHEVEAINV